MRVFIKLLFFIFLLLGNVVSAEKVLVLPTELNYDNYYSFPQVSQIMAEDIINAFNATNKMSAISLYDVNKKIAENATIKNSINYALSRYQNTNKVDFSTLKKIAEAFDVKSILIISSMVTQEQGKRNLWEVLEISSVFNATNTYNLETQIVLTDNINDVIMWSGKYTRKLGDNESRFWAKTTAQAVSQLEKIRTYSKDIISKNVVQNVTLRFYSKNIPVKEQSIIQSSDKTEFRPNPFNTIKQQKPESMDIDIESIYSL